ncbi:response regulator [Arsenicitalea aurantiaca]|uniref:histidine kinase n=1 Tax=Arsenicitalea aurantiaca TaxID=1783274 RepID=A0A433X449_9HYPH|nr:response regulator [Arsenicitalea aurantiaca]RUT28832.1 response regulator [Arsenicitalea aurantiaca]
MASSSPAGAAARPPLRILLLEDSDIDAELLESHLAAGELVFDMLRATSRESFVAGLDASPDLILADYSLPGFDGLAALALAREALPDVPFLFVSGVVGEEFATNALQHGAVDYITKRNLRRLPAAVRRAIAEARERSDRRKAEGALRASEISTRLAVAAAGLGSWDFDIVSNSFVWDAVCEDLFGFTDGPPRELGQFLAVIHPDDRTGLAAAIADIDKPTGNTELNRQFRVLRPGRELRWVEARGQSLFENGACVRFVGVLRDITEQKRQEEAMLERTASLEQSVELRTQERDQIWQHSHDLLAVADLDGWLRSVNPAWTAILGHSEETLLSAPLTQFVHPDDLAGIRAVRDAMRDTGRTTRFENRMLRADGSDAWFSWTAVPSGQMIYAIGRDISEQRVKAEELAEANRLLREQIQERERAENALRQMQRLEAVGQLTSGVAHDFNNLLTVILGNLNFIDRAFEGDDVDPKLKRRLSHMRIAADRGAALTAQLLAFSRRQRLEPRPVDLNETVASMRELLQTTMGGSVEIETHPDDALWHALVDPTQIEMIILNLAINARDAMGVGGRLAITTANVALGPDEAGDDLPEGQYVRLTVADTGTGMSEDVLAKALEPFFTTKDVGKGSGLGLAQVYGFARQSGGGVKIDTVLGEGTSVHVFLPRAEAPEAMASAAVQPEAVPERGDSTILLVDDDNAVREVTASLLREQGYRVVEAASGSEGLENIARADGVDLLVVDYAMPGMNGGDFVRAARRSRPDLPAVFLTGYGDLDDLETFSGDRVIQKPFKPNQLFAELDTLLPRAGRR